MFEFLFSPRRTNGQYQAEAEKPPTNLNCFGKPVGISLVHLLSGPISISISTLISISISISTLISISISISISTLISISISKVTT